MNLDELVKSNAPEVFRLLKAKCKVWLMFLQGKRQQEIFIGRLLNLKAIK